MLLTHHYKNSLSFAFLQPSEVLLLAEWHQRPDGDLAVGLLILISVPLTFTLLKDSRNMKMTKSHTWKLTATVMMTPNGCQTRNFGTYTLFFLLFLRDERAVATGVISCESSGRASASGLKSPTTGVACLWAWAACCSLAHLMELISERRQSIRGELHQCK